ncbi:XRE family transcriptional regulator [Pseudomonas silvicola]|nr:XRE family transcriptional regulator [Pseudomonas silvicola]
MITSGDRLKTLLQECHLSPSDLALHRNILPQHVNNWIRRGVPIARLDDIAGLLCVHTHWLRTGMGPKYRFPPPSPPLDPQDQFIDQDNLLHPAPSPTALAASTLEDVLIPFHRPLNQQLIAVDDRYLRLPREAIDSLCIYPDHCAALIMPDTSQAPRIQPGAALAIDRSHTLYQPGHLYAVLHGGDLAIRTLYPMTCDATRLRPHNLSQFSDELASATDAIEVLGWVFWWSTLQTRRPDEKE